MIKYQSIDQFRNVVRAVRSAHDFQGKDEEGGNIYQHLTPYPILTFRGTVKLHGTNGGIVRYKDGTTKFQSRERELSITSDNAGFYANMSGLDLDWMFEGIEFQSSIAVYGEWCGGNIQKGVALSQLPKMFVIFGVCIDRTDWVSPYGRDKKEDNIYCIDNFPTYEIDIDFNNPESIQNTLIKWTTEVEDECPVGKKFGVSGIGEGIVFTCVNDQTLKFKSKGEKHSSSKVKVLNSVDVEELESLKEFVDYACTDNRLKQGLENIPNQSPQNTGIFIKWVMEDILKEESDTIAKNQIEWKKVSGLIAKKAKEFYFNN